MTTIMSFSLNLILITMLISVANICHCQEDKSDSLLKQSPWFITLYITCPSVGTARTCGGSLINDKWILTTATCVQCKDINTIPMIVADIGSTANNAQNSISGVGRYIIDKVVIHHDFEQTKNNIALVHLQYSRSVISSSKHAMMQVMKCYQVNEAMHTNSVELLSHYGASADKLESGPVLGDKMELLKRKKCNKMSTACKSSAVTGLTEFCAAFKDSKNMSCGYDEGMGLGVYQGDSWIVAGIVFEKSRDCKSCPIWFIDVCNYYEWVQNIVSSTRTFQDIKCQPLEIPPNIILLRIPANTEAKVSAVAEFICPVGSILSTNNVILCQSNGTWSGPVPTCDPLDKCPRLQKPSNGKILYQLQNSYVGSEVIYQCDGQLIEISRKCLPGGIWENLAAECKSIDPPNNVKITVLAPKIIEVDWDPIISEEVTGYLIIYSTLAPYARGSNITVYGYNISKTMLKNLEENTLYSVTVRSIAQNKLSGFSNMVKAITWASAPTAAPRNVTGIRANPSSILVSWLPPLLIDHNGNLTGFTVLYRIVGSDIVQSVQLFANVSLYKITQLTPSAKYIIQVACINGNGTGPFSSSIELLSGDNKICKDVPSVSNGKVIYTGHLVGDTARYQCDSGYSLYGHNNIRRCVASGRWTGRTPRCKKICSPLMTPLNGHINYNSTTFSSLAYYSCNIGYKIIGTNVLQCVEEGLWNNTPPTCQVVTDCGIPLSPINGYVEYSSTGLHSIAKYQCNKNHVLVGYDTTQCVMGGKWDGVLPLCRKLCPTISNQPYRNRIQYDRTIGGITRFSCIPGFIMSGVSELKCKRNGKWTDDEPICYKECGSAPRISNGNFVQSGVIFGDTANYTCNLGYRLALNQIANLVCQQDGQWSIRPPYCIQITCPKLNSLVNILVNSSSTAVFSSVAFSCDSGYELVGDNVTVCQNDSTWSNSIPQCKRLCKRLSNPSNGAVKLSKLFEGNYANFSCDSGYTLLGSPAIICMSNGTWYPPSPICYKPCGNPTSIKNGEVTVSGRTPGSNATYFCDYNYQLIGNPTVICHSNSHWIGEVPKCKQIRCPRIKNFHNGTVILLDRTVGSTVNFTCDDGYILFGPATRNCTSLGSWTGFTPSCIRNCSTPSNIGNGSVTLRKTKETLMADYFCNSGYALVGNGSITCNSDGKWTEVSNYCEKVSLLNCSAPSAIDHGGVYVYTLPSNVKVARYYCDSGYFLVGNRTRNCLGRNIWSDTGPICKKFCDNPLPFSNGIVNVVATRTGQVAQYVCNNGYVLQGVSSRECSPIGVWKYSTPSCIRA